MLWSALHVLDGRQQHLHGVRVIVKHTVDKEDWCASYPAPRAIVDVLVYPCGS